MVDISIFQQLAKWASWPLVFILFFLISTIYFFIYKNKNDALKEHISYLKDKLEEEKQFRPDVVAKRLSRRHKEQMEVIELLTHDIDQDKEEIQKLNGVIDDTEKEMISLSSQYQEAINLLAIDLTRSGKINITVLRHFILEVLVHSKIFVPISLLSPIFNKYNTIKADPYFLTFETNMFRDYYAILNEDSQNLALIENLFEENSSAGIFDRDFKYTLQLLLSNLKSVKVNRIPGRASILPDNTNIIENNVNGVGILLVEIPLSLEDISNIPEVKVQLANFFDLTHGD